MPINQIVGLEHPGGERSLNFFCELGGRLIRSVEVSTRGSSGVHTVILDKLASDNGMQFTPTELSSSDLGSPELQTVAGYAEVALEDIDKPPQQNP